MPIPQPHDADSSQGGSLGSKKGADKASNAEWVQVPGQPGRYVNKDGRLKYNPHEDPAWVRYINEAQARSPLKG